MLARPLPRDLIGLGALAFIRHVGDAPQGSSAFCCTPHGSKSTPCGGGIRFPSDAVGPLNAETRLITKGKLMTFQNAPLRQSSRRIAPIEFPAFQLLKTAFASLQPPQVTFFPSGDSRSCRCMFDARLSRQDAGKRTQATARSSTGLSTTTQFTFRLDFRGLSNLQMGVTALSSKSILWLLLLGQSAAQLAER